MTKENKGTHKPIPYRLIILGIFLLAILSLQMAAASKRSFWEDEAFTASVVPRDTNTIIKNLKADVNPPLYWLLLHFWSKAFGTSESGLRSFSILLVIVTCLLTYKVAKDLFDDNVALIAVGLLTFSPLVLTYGDNARYYSLTAALSLFLVWMVHECIRKNNLLYLLFYGIAGTGLLYTMYTGATVLLALNLWWLIQWLRTEKKASHLLVWLMAQGLIILCYVPWLSTLSTTLHRSLPPGFWSKNWLTEIGLRVGYLGYAYGVGEFLSPLNPVLWLGMVLIAGLFIYALLKGKNNFWLPVIILGVAGVFSIGFNIIAIFPLNAWQDLSERTYFVYPLFIMILAYGIIRLRGKWKWGALAVVLLVYCVGIFNYFTDREAIKPILIVPWRTIMNDIQTKSTADATVICSADFACSYYKAQYGLNSLSATAFLRLSTKKPSEVWWIQSNLGNAAITQDASVKALALLQKQYQKKDEFHYAPQDNGIATLKYKFLGYQPYPFREVVTRFVLP